AVRVARRTDQVPSGGHAARNLVAARPDRGLRHPRPRRGGLPRRSGARTERVAVGGRGGSLRRPAAAAAAGDDASRSGVRSDPDRVAGMDRTQGRRVSRTRSWAGSAVIAVALLTVWDLVVRTGVVSFESIPGPAATWSAWWG